MVDGLIAMHLDKFRQSGAELIMGTGTFVGPKTIEELQIQNSPRCPDCATCQARYCRGSIR
jgi:hypothetical protein